MNRLHICLGSNAADAGDRIDHAMGILLAEGTPVADTGAFASPDEADAGALPYLNRLLILDTPLESETLRRRVKPYELAVRRLYRAPVVGIDIDIIRQNDTVLRPADASAPHYLAALAKLKG